MSKKQQNVSPSYGWCYAIEEYRLSHLEGRLLTLMESLGLRDTQEKAIKDLVKNEVWRLTSPCFIINAEDHDALRSKYQNQTFDSGTASGKVPQQS